MFATHSFGIDSAEAPQHLLARKQKVRSLYDGASRLARWIAQVTYGSDTASQHLRRFRRRTCACVLAAGVLLTGCGGSGRTCHDEAVREAKAQTASFFAPLPAASQAYRHSFYETSLRIALAKGCK